MQNDVLAAYPRTGFAGEDKFDGGRHFEPGFAGGHGRSHVGASDTGGKSSQSAVRAGVGVGADDHISWNSQTLFRDQSMFDPHFTHFKVVLDLHTAGELPDQSALFGGLDVLVRCEMIRDNGDLPLVKDLAEAGFAELVHRDRRGDVVPQHQVDIRHDQLAGLHLRKPGVGCQNFCVMVIAMVKPP